jgi:hypothetical protein
VDYPVVSRVQVQRAIYGGLDFARAFALPDKVAAEDGRSVSKMHLVDKATYEHFMRQVFYEVRVWVEPSFRVT